MAVKDKDGVVTLLTGELPKETDGLELIEVTEELKRLLTFESFVRVAERKGYKLLSAYFKYVDYLERNSIVLTEVEFEYIKRRLNKLNRSVSSDRRFNGRFWYMKRREHSNLKEERYETKERACEKQKKVPMLVRK